MSKQQADPSFVLNFFKDQLSNENVRRRLFAANNVCIIASAMGPEHASNELMQFLLEANQLDSEVQMALAGQFGNLIKYVGGPDNAHVLLGPLKALASADEPIVRERAISSIEAVCQAIPAANADGYMMQECKDLASAEFFTARASACAAIVKTYEKVNESNKTALRALYKSLVKDETPMVRRSALKYLPELCTALPSNIILGEVAKDILKCSISDDEDSVRLLLPASLSIISEKLNDTDRVALIVSLLKMLVKDGSWRVRTQLAIELPTISQPFPQDAIKEHICPIIFRLLRDPEAEAKSAACKSISGILALLGEQEEFIAEKFIPEISALTSDVSPQVRREVAFRIMEIASVIDRHNTTASIVPLFIQILRDNDNDASGALLQSLLQYVDKIDLAGMTPTIFPVILEISGETHWRVKIQIIRLIPPFAKVLGNDEFMKKLFALVYSWLSDSIYSVREEMASQLGELVRLFGVDWAVQCLCPVITKLNKNQNFLIRQVTFISLMHLQEVLPPAVLTKQFLSIVLGMANDRVPNIRFMVAKSLAIFLGSNDPKTNQQIQITLKQLQQDEDKDVRDFAEITLQKCQ